MAAPSTFANKVEYTYYTTRTPSSGSVIDHFFIPQGWLPRVLRCHVLHGLGAQWQVLPGAPPRDHLPLLLEL
eukprot:2130441-Pyramimonas_sp.AAC.1